MIPFLHEPVTPRRQRPQLFENITLDRKRRRPHDDSSDEDNDEDVNEVENDDNSDEENDENINEVHNDNNSDEDNDEDAIEVDSEDNNDEDNDEDAIEVDSDDSSDEDNDEDVNEVDDDDQLQPEAQPQKRVKTSKLPTKADWTVRPHNMGPAPQVQEVPVARVRPARQLPTAGYWVVPKDRPSKDQVGQEEPVLPPLKTHPAAEERSAQFPQEHSARRASGIDFSAEELLAALIRSRRTEGPIASVTISPPRHKAPINWRGVAKKPQPDDEQSAQVDAELEEAGKRPNKKRVRFSLHPYGLTPGSTPYLFWDSPLPEDCEEVHSLLAKLHGGAPKQPTITPPASLTRTGCGDVESVLDALLRTVLSGATTMENANRQLQALVKRFGVNDQNTLNWDAVRLATHDEVSETIKSGGLANIKTKHIKGILDQAHLDRNEVSLEHIRAMSATDAMVELTKFPGVGVKTASCVLLFCLRMPSFAVDTHIFRIIKWLGWVPPYATRDTAFSHCDHRIPDHLKYGLHQLMIYHGKSCRRCKGSTFGGTKEWEATVCPLEHLVKRDKRVAQVSAKASAKARGRDLEADEYDADVDAEFDGDMEIS